MVGLPVSAAFAAFFKAFFSEAGKDTYIQLKKLLAKIWTKQSDNTYALGSTVYIMFEFGEDHIAFELGTGRINNGQYSVKDLEHIIERDVAEILNSLPDIEKDIKSFGIGKTDGLSKARFHVIGPDHDSKWRIHGVSSYYFLD